MQTRVGGSAAPSTLTSLAPVPTVGVAITSEFSVLWGKCCICWEWSTRTRWKEIWKKDFTHRKSGENVRIRHVLKNKVGIRTKDLTTTQGRCTFDGAAVGTAINATAIWRHDAVCVAQRQERAYRQRRPSCTAKRRHLTFSVTPSRIDVISPPSQQHHQSAWRCELASTLRQLLDDVAKNRPVHPHFCRQPE